MTQENDISTTVTDAQADSSETESKKKKNQEPKRDKYGRIDSRLPLDADLMFDIKEIAKHLNLSKIDLITAYVRKGHANDLIAYQQLLQSKGFTQKYAGSKTSHAATSSNVSQASLPEEIAEALDDDETSGGSNSGSDD
jgi:hypothetical protein